jgi:type IV pilus assembly protein PilY1
MKRISTYLQGALCISSLFCAINAHAYNVLTISDEPLGTGMGVQVKPNLWFVLDNSGSMDWTFTPDTVRSNSNICQNNMSSFGSVNSCDVGDVPYMTNTINRSYYHPSIRYVPGANADGASRGNASPTAAKGEPYRYPNATATLSSCYAEGVGGFGGGNGVCNLTTSYPHRSYCTDSLKTNCKENTAAELGAFAFPYPNSTYRVEYQKTFVGAPYYYLTSGTILWCSNPQLTVCQTRRTGTYKYPALGYLNPVNGTGASLTLTIKNAKAVAGVTSVTINSPSATLVSSLVSVIGTKDDNNTRNSFAVALLNAMNGKAGYTVVQTTSCSGTKSNCEPVLKITAPYLLNDSAATVKNSDYNGATLSHDTSVSSGSLVLDCGTCTFSGGMSYIPAGTGAKFTRVDIVPTTTQYAIDPVTGKKFVGRTDCAGTSYCTYTEELQNFANWYSYYRARILMMKSAISLGFATVSDSAPGVGFRVGFSTINSTSTYELKIADFATGIGSQKEKFYEKLFSVYGDGSTPLRTALNRAGRVYAGEIYTGSDDPILMTCQQNYTFLSSDGYWNDSWSGVGNKDGTTSTTPTGIPTPPPYLDALNISDTLADIARYYYVTDLRTSMEDDVPKASGDETNASKMWQHMKTFTMGLGIDGNLQYSPNYLSGGSADYQSILAGTKDWGVPQANQPTAIDDMWHAAVNGHGQYFSAAVPEEVADGIRTTLAAAEQQTGSAAAAATSNLEPVAGDNYAYVASYTTNVWDGNLEAKTIDLSTGQLSAASTWSARELLNTKVASGTRTLYTYNASGGSKHKLMTWANLTLAEQTYFNPTQMTVCNPITNCPGATSENLFDFITGKPDATTNSDYRNRSHVLGDIVSSQPVYVKTPGFNYSDPGYDAYKTTLRQGMVYVGANDGYLHAFNADTGNEEWAYAPSAVLPNLWRLADPAYMHRYYVDGTLTAADIDVGGWKTILVGGLNAGGKYYYAWDVTTPASPVLLWEFTDADMGNSYGNPVVTKMTDGSWVVLVTSGYNNPNGQGYLYVLDAMTGVIKKKIGTGSGSSTQPSGLAKIANWVDDPMVNNTTKYVYGGDLNGDMWRFDLDAGSANLLANVPGPITTRPELAEVKYKRVVMFGTGLFLQADDRTDTGLRHIFAIKDDGTTPYSSVVGNASFVEQTFTSSGGTRTLSSNSVDWDTQAGWYIPLPDSGERVNVDPKIQLGTLVVPSNVPVTSTGNTCTVGGYAWLNYIDFVTGSDVKNSQGLVMRPSEKITGALAVGVNIVRLPDGKVVAITTTADNRHPVTEVPIGSTNVKARRISWRELTNN